MHSSSDDPSGSSPLGSTRGGSADIFPYHSVPALLHLGNVTTSGGLGVECLQPSLEVSGKLCVSSSCIASSSSVQVSGRTCQRSTQTFDSGGTVLDGWLPTVLSRLADVPWHCPIIKDLIVDVLVAHMFKDLPYLHLTLGCSEMCVTQTGVLFLRLSCSGCL